MTPPCSASRKYRSAARVAAERPSQRDVEDAVPLVVGHVDDGGLTAEAGVVDQDVDPAERGDGAVISASTASVDVTSHTTRVDRARGQLGQLRRGSPEPALVAVGDDDVGALGERPARGRRADAGARGGGHQRRPCPVSRPWPSISFGRELQRALIALDLPG